MTSQYTRTSRLNKPMSLVGCVAISRKLIVLGAHFRCSRQFDYDINCELNVDRFYNTVIFDIRDVYLIYNICHHISHYIVLYLYNIDHCIKCSFNRNVYIKHEFYISKIFLSVMQI